MSQSWVDTNKQISTYEQFDHSNLPQIDDDYLIVLENLVNKNKPCGENRDDPEYMLFWGELVYFENSFGFVSKRGGARYFIGYEGLRDSYTGSQILGRTKEEARRKVADEGMSVTAEDADLGDNSNSSEVNREGKLQENEDDLEVEVDRRTDENLDGENRGDENRGVENRGVEGIVEKRHGASDVERENAEGSMTSTKRVNLRGRKGDGNHDVEGMVEERHGASGVERGNVVEGSMTLTKRVSLRGRKGDGNRDVEGMVEERHGASGVERGNAEGSMSLTKRVSLRGRKGDRNRDVEGIVEERHGASGVGRRNAEGSMSLTKRVSLRGRKGDRNRDVEGIVEERHGASGVERGNAEGSMTLTKRVSLRGRKKGSVMKRDGDHLETSGKRRAQHSPTSHNSKKTRLTKKRNYVHDKETRCLTKTPKLDHRSVEIDPELFLYIQRNGDIQNLEMSSRSCYEIYLKNSVVEGDSIGFAYNERKYDGCNNNADASSDSDLEVLDKAPNCTEKKYTPVEDLELLNAPMEEDDLRCIGECRKTENPQFRKEVECLLKEPYNKEEYERLWSEVNSRKLMEGHKELRGGPIKTYPKERTGKSYLDHFCDLRGPLDAFKDDIPGRLNVLRGFFYYLKHMSVDGSFKPWLDKSCLSIAPETK